MMPVIYRCGMMPYASAYVMMISHRRQWMPGIEVSRITVPVPWRHIAYVIMASPEIIEQYRSVFVDRPHNVVVTINIWVADYNYFLLCLTHLLFGAYGCDILVDVIAEHRLQDDIMVFIIYQFHYSKIINISIHIKVEIRKHLFRVIETTFKFIKAWNFCEQPRYRFKVEIIRHLICPCFYGD